MFFGVTINVNATLDPTLVLGKQVVEDADHLNSGNALQFRVRYPSSGLHASHGKQYSTMQLADLYMSYPLGFEEII